MNTESDLRVDLAACYRLVARFGWDDLIFTHISVRVPGDAHHFLINPYGMLFDEITASSLVKVDADGRLVEPSAYPINPAGFVIHGAIHAARPDVVCVLHLHTPAGVAVSAQQGGLLPISQQSTVALASLGYHDYEGIALRDDEKPRLVRDLGANISLVLRNQLDKAGSATQGARKNDLFRGSPMSAGNAEAPKVATARNTGMQPVAARIRKATVPASASGESAAGKLEVIRGLKRSVE